TRRRASKFYPADGSSNVLSHGSVAVADWQRISKRQSPALLPGRSLLTSEPSRGDSQELEIKCNHYESDTKAEGFYNVIIRAKFEADDPIDFVRAMTGRGDD